jgi:hypothetical protein
LCRFADAAAAGKITPGAGGISLYVTAHLHHIRRSAIELCNCNIPGFGIRTLHRSDPDFMLSAFGKSSGTNLSGYTNNLPEHAIYSELYADFSRHHSAKPGNTPSGHGDIFHISV